MLEMGPEIWPQPTQDKELGKGHVKTDSRWEGTGGAGASENRCKGRVAGGESWEGARNASEVPCVDSSLRLKSPPQAEGVGS